MSNFNLEDWKRLRQRARTDLYFLCHVLGHKDVGPSHLPIVASLQRFHGGTESKNEITVKDGAGYEPAVALWELKGKRKNLRLVTRGGLKTTIITQAHSIQWIINYPDLRIILGSYLAPRAKDFLRAIKESFRLNEFFRWLFPEYCPKTNARGRVEEFGNTEEFTIPCRRATGISQPTMRVTSVESSVAGGHYEVGKIDDWVEDKGCETPTGIEGAKKALADLWPLIETSEISPGHGWLDVTGTIYNFSDAHWTIYSAEIKKLKEQRQWGLLYIPAADDYPHCTKMFWPKRITAEYLRGIEDDVALGPKVLHPQYLLKPLQDKDGLIETKDDIRWIERWRLDQLAPRLVWNVTVDLAGTEEAVSKSASDNYSVINLHGWGTDGRCYFDKIIWGRFSVDEIIDRLFAIFAYKPQIQFIKISKDAYQRMLMASMKKEMAKRGVILPIMELDRGNQISKVQWIKGTQPYWKFNAFIFCEDIETATRNQLEMEAQYFPKFNFNDILDTITDALRDREGIISEVEGRIKPLPEVPEAIDGQVLEHFGIPPENLPFHILHAQEDESQFGVDPMTGM